MYCHLYSCSVEWLLRYVLSLKKTKHSKQTSAKNESEELDKQIEQTIAVLQRYIRTYECMYVCTYVLADRCVCVHVYVE